MQKKPNGWDSLWKSAHRIQWQYIIDGIIYSGSDIRQAGTINRPLMDRPTIGRCCTGDLTLTVQDKPDHEIPKAATVIAQCRLTNLSGTGYTEWVDQGHYWVSKRFKSAGLTTLTCRDAMIFAGRTYLDRSSFTEWPVSMVSVVTEIASIMGVEIDSRTAIKSGSIYRVSYPNEDILMSEVLAYIASAHGGSFVITPENKLRLIPYPEDSGTVQFDLGGHFSGYTPYSTGRQMISRVTLSDDADNQFTVGDDTGVELASECIYATQAMVTNFSDWLIGQTFFPYSMSGAYIDPLLELGDTFTASYKGVQYTLLACTMQISCTDYATASISNYMDEDDEEEVPYTSPSDLRSDRYISTTKSYRGNRINRTEGFVSEYMENDEPIARLVANSDQISMQRLNPTTGKWEDILYFDTVNKTYKFVGEVDVQVPDAGAKTYCQDEPPTEKIKDGDLWIDSNDNYKLYRYDGSVSDWVSVQDLNIPDIIGQLSSANTAISVLSTGINAKVDSTYLTEQINSLVKTFTSSLNLKADELSLSFAGVAQDAAGQVNDRFETLIRASGDGVEIGKAGSNFRVVITNEELAFYDGTNKIAYMNKQKMFITAAQVTSSLEIGQDGGNTFSWVKTEHGLSLSYVSATV